MIKSMTKEEFMDRYKREYEAKQRAKDLKYRQDIAVVHMNGMERSMRRKFGQV